jgi:hypothetical protein
MCDLPSSSAPARKAGTQPPDTKCPPDQPRLRPPAIRLALTTIHGPKSVVTSLSVDNTQKSLVGWSMATARTWPRICPPFSRLFRRLRRALHPLNAASSGARQVRCQPSCRATFACRELAPILIYSPQHGEEYARRPVVLPVGCRRDLHPHSPGRVVGSESPVVLACLPGSLIADTTAER